VKGNAAGRHRVGALLAVGDMEQTIDAARMLADELENGTSDARHHYRRRALETAVAVTYARSLVATTGAYSVRQDLREPDGDAAMKQRHADLIRLRHKSYAHNGARPADMTNAKALAEMLVMTISAMDVPGMIALAEHQRDRFARIAFAE
jgi:hypothetical protein